MRGKMILLRIVIQVLVAIGEIETRHAPAGAFAGQIQLGEILRELGADRAEDPIELAHRVSSADALVREIPDVPAPGLQFDELEAGAPRPT